MLLCSGLLEDFLQQFIGPAGESSAAHSPQQDLIAKVVLSIKIMNKLISVSLVDQRLLTFHLFSLSFDL